jgi:hypothetical protein
VGLNRLNLQIIAFGFEVYTEKNTCNLSFVLQSRFVDRRVEAEENLRVIRSLMERATIYRAISAPGALGGGLVSALATGTGCWLSRQSAPPVWAFFSPWMLTLLITASLNLWLLAREAKANGEFWISPRMRVVLRAMAPGFLAGGVSLALVANGGLVSVASLWVLFYGMALLATGHFAPQSLRVLGWSFFSAGAVSLLIFRGAQDAGRAVNDAFIANLIMGSTFGLFHLIYGALTWPRRTKENALSELA